MAMCNDIESTKKIYYNNEINYRFHNLTTNKSLLFYNCKEVKLPPDNSCNPTNPSPAQCNTPTESDTNKKDKDKKEDKKPLKDKRKDKKPNPFKNNKPAQPDMTCKIK
ncbi:hypothetical protein VWJ57_03455 [Escherichia coli O157]|nr:hypothetical protein [Escherichia coli O157]HAN4697483.1 hypothetical protein [Escherichia coli]HBN4943355.1 hypothetical protein [Escherichia coli]